MLTWKLFPIPMQGQGTADVESLPSYLLRSAYAHGASGGVLLQVIHELGGCSQKTKPRSIAGKHGIATLARVNQFTWELRNRLAEYTGQDMSCEPLRFLDSQVYCISTEIGTFRWCPECLAEMARIEAPLYFKQLWHMTAVGHCPVHRVRLSERCEFCGCKQHSLKAKHPVGYCAECGEPLFNRRTPLSTKDIQPSWECPSHDVLEIFEQAARPGMTVNGWFDACWFIRSMAASADHGRENSHLTGELRELLREFGRNWKGNCRLISLRRLAYLMNMSLYELLTCSGTAYRLSYDVLNIQSLPEHLKRRKKTVRNHKHVYRKLVAYLEEQQIPPSLKQAARFAQVSPGYLEYRFPSLVRRIVERYQAYRHQITLVNRYRAQAAALQFFTGDRYADHSRSRKEAYRVLKEETGLPKWVLKNAIQTAYGVLQVGAG